MTAAPPTAEPRQRINSVARGINILLAVAHSEQGLSANEIGAAIGVERQTAYHLLHTLVALGMLTRDESRRYQLGLRVGVLAEAFREQFSAPDYLRPLVRQLANATGETCYAVGWWQGEIVTLAVVRGTNSVQTAEVPHGQYDFAHARAAGKLLLALAPVTRRSDYLSRHPLVARTSKSITERAALDGELAKIRAQGHAIDDEEFASGVCCLAVALDRGESPFALALSAPADRFHACSAEYLAQVSALASPSRQG